MNFILINTHKNYPILPQQVPCQPQPGVHHGEPFGVEAAVGFGVGGEFLSFVVDLSGTAEVVFEGFGEVVVVDEVVAGVVGRVDVDHLDAAGVGLLHDLEHFEVFAFDEDVAGVVGAVGVRGAVGNPIKLRKNGGTRCCNIFAQFRTLKNSLPYRIRTPSSRDEAGGGDHLKEYFITKFDDSLVRNSVGCSPTAASFFFRGLDGV